MPSRRQAAFSRVGVIPSGAFSRRQIRDLEIEVGVPLLERRARGIELTPAGRVFLDYAQLALLQVETAGEAARRVAQPEKRLSFSASSSATRWFGCRKRYAFFGKSRPTSRLRCQMRHPVPSSSSTI